MQNPLVIFVGAAIATLAALLGVTYDKWSGEPVKTEQVAAAPGEGADASGGVASAAEKIAPPDPSATEPSTSQSAASATAQSGAAQDLASIETPSAPATKGAAARPEAPADDSIPTFDTIRIETDGSAVMAGRGLPSADVTVMLDGRPLGMTTTDLGGAWVLVPTDPLPAGDHDLTLEMQMSNSPPVRSEQSVAVKVPEPGSDQALVVLNDPNQASKVLQQPKTNLVADASTTSEATAAAPSSANSSSSPDKPKVEQASRTSALTLNTVDYNEKGDIIFSGNATANSTVRLYVDNSSIADAKVDPSGAWTFAGRSEIAPGNHTLRVDQLNSNAKVSQRIELPFVRAEPQEVVALTEPAGEGAASPSAAATAQTAVEPAAQTEAAAGSSEQAAPTAQPAEAQADATVAAETAAQSAGGASTTVVETTSESAAAPAATAALETSVQNAQGATSAAVSSSATAGVQAAASPPAASGVAPEIARNGRVVIQPGNNLWQISRVIYGQGVHYTVIYQANKEQIRNPNLIYPGQIFATPGAVPPEKIDPTQRAPLENASGGTTSG